MILKGVSHLHTTYSYDGTLSLREFKDFLIEQEIDFAFITEHTDELEAIEGERFIKECHNLSDEKITLIPGFEVPYNDAHILMLGAEHFVKKGACDASDLKKWRANAEFAIWAHPHRNKYLLYDAIRDVIDGVEVWNSQYDGKIAPRIKVLTSLQGARSKEENLVAFCGLDFHRKEHVGGPSIMLECRNRQKEIIEMVQAGNYVIKTGAVTISSKGDIIKGYVRLVKIQSLLSIALITSLKKLSALSVKLHLPIPKKMRKAIRSKI